LLHCESDFREAVFPVLILNGRRFLPISYAKKQSFLAIADATFLFILDGCMGR
jgi:hypothetical protein